MRLIDADVFRLRLASIAKTFARTDAQRSLMGRCIYCLDKTTTVAEWVSVKDRLPEKSGCYLAITIAGSILVLNYSNKYKMFNCFDDLEPNGNQLEVTHWMPIPEPPKEDE